MRSQWNSLTEFNDRVMGMREVFHSIVDNEASSCVLDGTDIGVHVPGLLLRERSEEIHQVIFHACCLFIIDSDLHYFNSIKTKNTDVYPCLVRYFSNSISFVSPNVI